MDIRFEPITKLNQDEFNILENGVPIGTFFWKRNHPKPGDKMAIVRDLEENVFLCANESQAIAWLKKYPSITKVAISLLSRLVVAEQPEEQRSALDNAHAFLLQIGVLNASDN
jgi:hypothetical protein